MFLLYRTMSSGAPVEHGTPIRYPSAALLCVNSEDQQLFDKNGYRIDATIPGRIYINNQRPLMFGYMTRLALTEMNVVWDTPNVNSKNNTLTMSIYSATDASPPVVALVNVIRIAILPEFYNQTQLATAVQTELNNHPDVIASGLTFSVTYNNDEKNFRIAQTAAYAGAPNRVKGYFKLISSSAPISYTGYASLQDDLTFCMGLQSINYTNTIVEPTGYYSDIYGAYAPMVQTPYVDVVSNLLTKNQNVADGTSAKNVTASKLARIYFTNEAIVNEHLDSVVDTSIVNNTIGITPFKFRREFKVPKQIQWNSTENVDAIDISVIDYKGNEISITEQFTVTASAKNEITLFERNNTSFQFTIMVTEV